MEEPGNLEFENKTALGQPAVGNHFGALATELEYGATAWWTTELYLDGQTTSNESTIATGFRWENRFRMLMKEHLINPVLDLEFENISGADKNILGVVGHDGQSDLAEPNAATRQEREHEGELITRSRSEEDSMKNRQSWVVLATAIFAFSVSGTTVAQNQPSTDKGQTTVTGCLSGPNDEGAYVLKSSKGHAFEVGGDDQLKQHVAIQ